MRALGVVVLPPAFDDDLGFGHAVEQLAVQKLVAELGVEALAVTVLPWASRLDERRFRTDRRDPLPHRPGDELRAVVRTNMSGHAAQDEEVGQDVDDVSGLKLPVDPDGDAFPGELVDHVQHAELPPVVSAVLDEVVGPDVVGIFRPKSDAGSIVQPQPASLRLPGRDLQPFLAPDPLDALDVHSPAGGLNRPGFPGGSNF